MATTKETTNVTTTEPRSTAAGLISPFIPRVDREALERQAAEDEVRFAAEARQAAEQAGVAGRAAQEREAHIEAQQAVIAKSQKAIDHAGTAQLERAFAAAQANQSIDMNGLASLWVELLEAQELRDRVSTAGNRQLAVSSGAAVGPEPEFVRPKWCDIWQATVELRSRAAAGDAVLALLHECARASDRAIQKISKEKS
jgi:hypothetical protein